MIPLVSAGKTGVSHPERTVRVATSFSDIGAPELALERLGLKTKIVFACDLEGRYLKFNFKQLGEMAVIKIWECERQIFLPMYISNYQA